MERQPFLYALAGVLYSIFGSSAIWYYASRLSFDLNQRAALTISIISGILSLAITWIIRGRGVRNETFEQLSFLTYTKGEPVHKLADDLLLKYYAGIQDCGGLEHVFILLLKEKVPADPIDRRGWLKAVQKGKPEFGFEPRLHFTWFLDSYEQSRRWLKILKSLVLGRQIPERADVKTLYEEWLLKDAEFLESLRELTGRFAYRALAGHPVLKDESEL